MRGEDRSVTFAKEGKSLEIPAAVLEKISAMTRLARKWNVELNGNLYVKNGRVLDFDYPEVSVGLFRIYQWCLDCLRKGDYSSAMSALRDLNEAWGAAEKKMTLTGATRAMEPRPDMTRAIG